LHMISNKLALFGTMNKTSVPHKIKQRVDTNSSIDKI